MVEVEKEGVKHQLARWHFFNHQFTKLTITVMFRYKVDVGGPRPGEILQLRKPKMKLEFSAHHKILTSFAESYNEDFSLANKLPEGNRRDWLVQ